MATNIPKGTRASSSTTSRRSSRDGAKYARSKPRVKIHRGRKLIFYGAPRCFTGSLSRKACRSTAYKQYGSSSDSARAHHPLVVEHPCEELERSFFALSPLMVSGKNFSMQPVVLSSDSSEENLTDTNDQGHGDSRSRDCHQGNQNEATHEESEKSCSPNHNDEDIRQGSLFDRLRLHQTTFMESIVREVSPTSRLEHFQDKGYFRHDYSKDERTTSNMANMVQGKKKGIQSLYYMLRLKADKWFKTRSPNDADISGSPMNSRHLFGREQRHLEPRGYFC